MGSGTYAHAATKYRANNSDDSALDVLMARHGGAFGYRLTFRAVSNANKQNGVVRARHARH